MATPISGANWIASAGVPAYTGILNAATGSRNFFNMFKSHPAFWSPVGITGADYAMRSLSRSLASNLSPKMPVSGAKNDTYGSPFFTRLSGSRILGNDTARFYDTITYISEYLTGSLNGKSVYEWGSCYGGLMTCMLEAWPNINTYYVNDLPEVVNFSQYYVNQLQASASLSFTTTIWQDPTGSNPPTASYDLFVAEYSITEFDSTSMYTLYDDYGKPANGVFIRANLIQGADFINFVNHIEQDFTCSVIDEKGSRIGNKIIIGYKSGSW